MGEGHRRRRRERGYVVIPTEQACPERSEGKARVEGSAFRRAGVKADPSTARPAGAPLGMTPG
jgi:hypothetical protein